MDKVHCPVCDEDRAVDIYDVLAKNKKRIVCGHCKTVLMEEEDIVDYFVYLSQAGWWAVCD